MNLLDSNIWNPAFYSDVFSKTMRKHQNVIWFTFIRLYSASLSEIWHKGNKLFLSLTTSANKTKEGADSSADATVQQLLTSGMSSILPNGPDTGSVGAEVTALKRTRQAACRLIEITWPRISLKAAACLQGAVNKDKETRRSPELFPGFLRTFSVSPRWFISPAWVSVGHTCLDWGHLDTKEH